MKAKKNIRQPISVEIEGVIYHGTQIIEETWKKHYQQRVEFDGSVNDEDTHLYKFDESVARDAMAKALLRDLVKKAITQNAT